MRENRSLMSFILLLLLAFHCLCMTARAFSQTQPLTGRLIGLEVTGPDAARKMFESFLTERNFILVEDEAVPRFFAKVNRRQEGSRFNARVTYELIDLALRIPGVGSPYVAPPMIGIGVGVLDKAEKSAVAELMRYVANDRNLARHLKRVGEDRYYSFSLSGGLSEYRLDQIEDKLMTLAAGLEKNSGVVSRIMVSGLSESAALLRLDKRIKELKEAIDAGYGDESRKKMLGALNQQKQLINGLSRQVRDFAASLQTGSGNVTEKMLVQILENQKIVLRSTRAMKLPYLQESIGKPEKADELKDDGAVLIKVPMAAGNRLDSRPCRIYAENQHLVYEHTKEQLGPRVYRSISEVKKSAVLGDSIRTPGGFLEIQGTAFFPDDRAVIISNRDADAMMYINRAGQYSGTLFKDGRIALIPEHK